MLYNITDYLYTNSDMATIPRQTFLQLDIKIRLCIRDSLFRLAQSAMQRHYASDTSSTNKSSREELEFVAREESNSQNRSGKLL